LSLEHWEFLEVAAFRVAEFILVSGEERRTTSVFKKKKKRKKKKGKEDGIPIVLCQGRYIKALKYKRTAQKTMDVCALSRPNNQLLRKWSIRFRCECRRKVDIRGWILGSMVVPHSFVVC
jgi:hypothetical protein